MQSSRNIWVISDTHFNHENIIKYCNRPFKSPKEMDEYMVEMWNQNVKPGDIVYHLGDVYFGKGSHSKDEEKKWDNMYGYMGKLFSKLHGRKRLILGNHDNGKDKLLLTVFQKIMVWRMFPEFGLLLTHVPVHESALVCHSTERTGKMLLNVHGHQHDQPDVDDLHRNVCVEHTGYKPINIEELRVK